MKMKKIAIVLLLTLSSMFVAPKKSEAGIILITTATGGAATVGYIIGSLSLSITALGLDSFISARRGGCGDCGDGAFYLGLLGLILDADGSLPSDKLVIEFSRKYSFIENTEVIEDLVNKIKEKAGILIPNEKKLISLSSTEIDSILTSIDTTGLEKEIEMMKKDLE